MKISSGLIITDNKQILLGKITGSKKYDIPKGGIDENETPLETMIREVKEETNLKIKKDNVEYLGFFDYIPNKKKLHLFKMVVEKMPEIKALKCNSFFIHKYGRSLPELSDFIIIDIKELKDYVFPNMFKVLNKNLYKS